MADFHPPFDKAADQEEGAVLAPRFDAAGLVTAVVTDATSGTLLMVAHMDRQALDLTISSGIAHYFSRSRQSLWKKGETSGALQTVREIRVDCDHQQRAGGRVGYDRLHQPHCIETRSEDSAFLLVGSLVERRMEIRHQRCL
ncbi:MAG: hypothetical protein EOP70_15795, partial [Variovorax sp.]